MVKAKPREISGLLKNLPEEYRAVLIFGKDPGLIRERRDILIREIAGDEADPFSNISLEPKKIQEDPAILADEMGAVSMMGGRRIVRVDEATDSLTKPVQECLGLETGDSILILSAGDLGPRSKLRTFFEKESAVLAIPCYADTAETLAAMIRAEFQANNIRVNPDIIAYLSEHLGNDRMITRKEIEKLVLYAGGKKDGEEQSLTLEEVQLLTSDASALTLGSLARAATGTDSKRLAELLDKAGLEGIGPIEILRTVQFRLQQLHLARSLVDSGVPLNDALKKLRPPIFFKERDAFISHLRNWPLKRLSAALDYSVRAEAGCKKTGVPDQTLAARACMDICASARKNASFSKG